MEDHTPEHQRPVDLGETVAAPALGSDDEPEQRTPYVREPRQHKSVDPIDDYAHTSEAPAHMVSDSQFTGKASMLSGRSYRRTQRDINRVRSASKYGQYLEIPKGRREIFVRRERRSHLLTALALIVVLALLAGALYGVWILMQHLLPLHFG